MLPLRATSCVPRWLLFHSFLPIRVLVGDNYRRRLTWSERGDRRAPLSATQNIMPPCHMPYCLLPCRRSPYFIEVVDRRHAMPGRHTPQAAVDSSPCHYAKQPPCRRRFVALCHAAAMLSPFTFDYCHVSIRGGGSVAVWCRWGKESASRFSLYQAMPRRPPYVADMILLMPLRLILPRGATGCAKVPRCHERQHHSCMQRCVIFTWMIDVQCTLNKISSIDCCALLLFRRSRCLSLPSYFHYAARCHTRRRHRHAWPPADADERRYAMVARRMGSDIIFMRRCALRVVISFIAHMLRVWEFDDSLKMGADTSLSGALLRHDTYVSRHRSHAMICCRR